MSTLASEQSMRVTSCNPDISSEKMPTACFSRSATFRAIVRASAVLPILGRAARTFRLLG